MITELDHLVIGVPHLDEGIEWWAELTGVRPKPGGPHEGLGTRNALVALGPVLYLELLAPDPEQATRSPVRDSLSQLEGPSATGWCFGCDRAAETHRQLSADGVDCALVPMSRTTPEGETLSWELILFSHSLGPAIPFVIDWGSAQRPVEGAPAGCRLLEVTPIHPEPVEAQALFDRLGIQETVSAGSCSGMRFRFDSPRGEVVVET